MKNKKRDPLTSRELKKTKEVALHYFETLVEVARESFIILNSDLQVISANPTFYQNFMVTRAQTENKFIYDLGNGQWNIPDLKRLLEDILPKKKTVKNYEVTHVFPSIGEKTILLNARQIDSVQLIVLALEDITDKKQIENKLADYNKELKAKVKERTEELENRLKEVRLLNKTMVGRELKMMELKKEIESLKKRVKNGNGKNGNGKNGNGKNGNGDHKK